MKLRTKDEIDRILAEYKGECVHKWLPLFNSRVGCDKSVYNCTKIGCDVRVRIDWSDKPPLVAVPRADSTEELVNFAVKEGILLYPIIDPTDKIVTIHYIRSYSSVTEQTKDFNFKDYPSPAEALKAALGNVICDVIEKEANK